ncbi:MAG: glycosyl hydrolase [Phycisphaerae bacterium]|nr:glycosyl hydrolase [Phycisphaerae bacterium]
MKRVISTICIVSLFLLQNSLLAAQDPEAGGSHLRSEMPPEVGTVQLNSELFGELGLRSLGPAFKPGRVADIAVDPQNSSIWYLANASSGLWKTTNRGIDWEPIFDKGGSYSLGCVTIDPQNSDVIWLGTGENSSNRSVGFGDGVYKSTDGGDSWTHMGLSDSQHIGRILVDRRNSDVVFVAAEGPLWSAGGDRGLFKTTDGGKTWKSVLKISDDTGVTDIAFDPRNPDVVYAASYQRRRHVGLLIGGGPESAIYKSANGGQSWKKLSNGLPSVDIGRISLAVSPQKPDIVYALIYAAGDESGFFRSADRGETWTRQSNYKVIDPQYYGEIYADPHKFDRIYTMDMRIHVTEDGGKNFKPLKWQMHVDNHAMAFDLNDSNHLLVGNDGGLYESYDHGAIWRHFTNLPTSQFYRVAVDNALPFYNVYGGTQDNGSMGGPSRTVNSVGIRSSEWFPTGGGDGFQPRIDPENPDIVYGLSQNGAAFRLDKRTGVRTSISPNQEPGTPAIRWHWDTPLLISPHSHKRVYLAGNRLYRSDDRGDNFQPVSGDLTRGLDAENQPIMGRIWGADAVQKNNFTTALSVISALDESPLQEGLLYVGTDDGLLQVSGDGGKKWRRIEKFPGIPLHAYISDVCASQHDPDILYAAFNNYQVGDFKPYLLKSHDRGKTWTSIAGNLPDRHVVWSIVEDHLNPKLLFAGTEFGLFFTVDGGQRWVQLRAGAPTVAFRDLALQRRENDLVCATFGRGFYVLDDYTPLRHIEPQVLAENGFLFPPRDALVYNELGYVISAFGNFTTPNPPFGAIVHYYLSEEFTRNGGDKIVLDIKNAKGEQVREISVPATAGLHRVLWDLRSSTDPKGQTGKQGRRKRSSKELVEPGEYTISLLNVINGREISLGKSQTIKVKSISGTR